MNKNAFRSVKGTFTHVKRILKTRPDIAYGLAGAAGQGGASYGAMHLAEKYVKKSPEFKKLDKKEKEKRLKQMKRTKLVGTAANTVLGALNFGLLGADERDARRWTKSYRSNFGGRRSYGGGHSYSHKPKAAPVPEWLKGVKTKAEAKTKFREQAKAHHPDRGGSEEKMKQVNTAWDDFQKHHFHKLAFLIPSFMEELESIREASR